MRAELIDGVIYDMAPPLSVHQLLSAKIHGYLARYIEKKGGSCIPFFAPIGVQLDKDDKTIVEQDILIVCQPKLVDFLEKCLIYGHIRRFAN